MEQWGKRVAFGVAAFALGFAGAYLIGKMEFGAVAYSNLPETGKEIIDNIQSQNTEEPAWPLPLDTEAYDERLLAMVNYQPPQPETVVIPATATSATSTRSVEPPSPLRYDSDTNVTIEGRNWPAAAPYPNGGAILPFQRIVAYYGNFYSRHMGILGELDPEPMLAHLDQKVSEWEAADPTTPVKPAIHYIAMVAQADAGSDGMYRAMMPDEQIEKGYDLAKQIDAIYILDLQVGLSTIQQELPKFREFLTRPEVHLGIDPEFSMKTGDRPGTVIGSFDAADINYVIEYMAELVREYQLPPKVLVIHRFTDGMVTNTDKIKPVPEVQVVMHMDGWGPKQLKRGTYQQVILPEPVQFTGVKVFYKNDLKPPSTGILTPAELLDLQPIPLYIQYQ